jgi:hypothetical protein
MSGAGGNIFCGLPDHHQDTHGEGEQGEREIELKALVPDLGKPLGHGGLLKVM